MSTKTKTSGSSEAAEEVRTYTARCECGWTHEERGPATNADYKNHEAARGHARGCDTLRGVRLIDDTGRCTGSVNSTQGGKR